MRYGRNVSFMLFLFCLAPIGFAFAQADNAPVTCGTYRTLHSKVLGEDRRLLIRLPDDYGKSDKKYPVLYKLDGGKGNFLQAFSAAYYLFDMTEKAPDPIIVGIENTDRNRDMGPDQGADNFIQFFKTELTPFIDGNYRTSGFRILCGQSYSALFALYAFLKQPSISDAYLLSSFGIYKQDLAVLFEKELRRNQDLRTIGKKCLFVANGRQDAYDPDGSTAKRGAQFLDSLRQTVPASVVIKSKYYEDEGHVPYPSLYDGLRWIYSCEETTSK